MWRWVAVVVVAAGASAQTGRRKQHLDKMMLANDSIAADKHAARSNSKSCQRLAFAVCVCLCFLMMFWLQLSGCVADVAAAYVWQIFAALPCERRPRRRRWCRRSFAEKQNNSKRSHGVCARAPDINARARLAMTQQSRKLSATSIAWPLAATSTCNARRLPQALLETTAEHKRKRKNYKQGARAR